MVAGSAEARSPGRTAARPLRAIFRPGSDSSCTLPRNRCTARDLPGAPTGALPGQRRARGGPLLYSRTALAQQAPERRLVAVPKTIAQSSSDGKPRALALLFDGRVDLLLTVSDRRPAGLGNESAAS